MVALNDALEAATHAWADAAWKLVGPDEELTHVHMHRALVDWWPEGAPELQRHALYEGSNSLFRVLGDQAELHIGNNTLKRAKTGDE